MALGVAANTIGNSVCRVWCTCLSADTIRQKRIRRGGALPRSSKRVLSPLCQPILALDNRTYSQLANYTHAVAVVRADGGRGGREGGRGGREGGKGGMEGGRERQ